MRLLGIAGALSLSSYYFIWRAIFPEDYENLPVRLVGSVLCIPAIVFANRQEAWVEEWLTLYWTLSVTYVLPFVFGFMLIQNASHAPAIGATSVIWPMQNVVALVLFIFLINDGVLATLLWLLATAFVLVSVPILSSSPNWEEIERVFLQPLPMYAFILVVGSLTIRNREMIDQEKLRAVASVGSTIAHELRTPLLGIRALAEGIRSHLPSLLNAYEVARAHGLPVGVLRTRQIALLRSSVAHIQREADQSNSIIDMLLINSAERPLQGLEFDDFSACACIDHAVQRYPFGADSERNLVTLTYETDFRIRAPRILIEHVLLNLVKNALYYVAKAGRGSIRIAVRCDLERAIVVEDTGTGISPEVIGRIFERFFTTTETGQGSGIGLTFCKMVLEGIGGSIVCESEFERYTRFILSFPPEHR